MGARARHDARLNQSPRIAPGDERSRHVAVANTHTKALAAAHETTASNMEDDVILALERLLAGM